MQLLLLRRRTRSSAPPDVIHAKELGVLPLPAPDAGSFLWTLVPILIVYVWILWKIYRLSQTKEKTRAGRC